MTVDATELVNDPTFHHFIVALIHKAASKQPWRARAACLDAPPEWFHPVNPDERTPGYDLCAGCPVAAECLDHAQTDRIMDVDNPDWRGWQVTGVWSGTSYRDRQALRG